MTRKLTVYSDEKVYLTKRKKYAYLRTKHTRNTSYVVYTLRTHVRGRGVALARVQGQAAEVDLLLQKLYKKIPFNFVIFVSPFDLDRLPLDKLPPI